MDRRYFGEQKGEPRLVLRDVNNCSKLEESEAPNGFPAPEALGYSFEPDQIILHGISIGVSLPSRCRSLCIISHQTSGTQKKILTPTIKPICSHRTGQGSQKCASVRTAHSLMEVVASTPATCQWLQSITSTVRLYSERLGRTDGKNDLCAFPTTFRTRH